MKQFLGICLAIAFTLHGLVIPYLNVSKSNSTLDTKSYYIYSALGEYYGDHSILVETPVIAVNFEKQQLKVDSEFHRNFNFINIQHWLIANEQIKKAAEIIVDFGIRELKFPTHFFW
ncbi:hypothetical protein ACFOUP_01610 [Belliella kenyensis]|uniref:Uncharacterized protein n=2 Tax=Belliella kenyensis TaxID=1472724 RepID=A0ABV8EG91_9BACT|nr:hypothetical protein [Belliella kenyensis]